MERKRWVTTLSEMKKKSPFFKHKNGIKWFLLCICKGNLGSHPSLVEPWFMNSESFSGKIP